MLKKDLSCPLQKMDMVKKSSEHFDYRVTNRGGKGIIGIINSPRNGSICSSFPVFEGDDDNDIY